MDATFAMVVSHVSVAAVCHNVNVTVVTMNAMKVAGVQYLVQRKNQRKKPEEPCCCPCCCPCCPTPCCHQCCHHIHHHHHHCCPCCNCCHCCHCCPCCCHCCHCKRSQGPLAPSFLRRPVYLYIVTPCRFLSGPYDGHEYTLVRGGPLRVH